METLIQWLLVAAAIGIGWLIATLQQRQHAKSQAKPSARPPRSLQYLFDAYDAPTLDSFVQDLQVNQDTLQLHLAIANFFRRKGEIEKATAIHQKLLAGPTFETLDTGQLYFELAQDYLAAGLYDRAEGLFENLLEDPVWQARAMERLLEIYEHEKDWELARNTVLSLSAGPEPQWKVRIGQYCCELAERSLRRKDPSEAEAYLQQALQYDPKCVRAALLLAKLAAGKAEYSLALEYLATAESQDEDFLLEILPQTEQVYCKQGRESDFKIKLQQLWKRQPSARLMVKLAQYFKQQDSTWQATEFLLRELDEHPSLEGTRSLLELLAPYADTETQRWIKILLEVLESLLEKQADYRCRECGFSGGLLHWLCPQCKSWATVKPLLWKD